ncbi:carbohydrate porin [Curvibacter delicatus]|jgi:hypothetical protein|uniref:carbohydrate porin n=1 Tax=Curvibacter delicatus TaxID=80879 RepID=UPI000834E778|nr:carbohydrate porin [Curvibacter delicatus]
MRFVCKFVLLWACLPYAWAADAGPDNWLRLPGGDSPWRLHGDVNLIGQFHDSFPSLYESTPDQGGNSLQSAPERSQTTMLGLNIGYRNSSNTEFWYRAEAIRGVALSDAGGLAGLTNSDLQRVIQPDFMYYTALAYVRHRFDLGGSSADLEEDNMHFAQAAKSRRFTLTVGKQDLLGIYDYNSYAHKGPNGFLNWSLMTSSAFDFAADARGYTFGITGELAWDDYSIRFGRYLMPVLPNQLDLDFEGWWKNRVGYNLELEKRWATGAVRLVWFSNRMRLSTYASTANIASIDSGFDENGANPRIDRTKTGVGFNIEQVLAPALSIFARGMTTHSDGETMAFTEADSSLSAGVVAQGQVWGRPFDAAGLGFSNQYASADRQAYLGRGLYALFIGDGPNPYGPVRYGNEQIIEAYYLIGLSQQTHLTLDWQRITNPAYNPDRGPVDVWGLRLHMEF